MPPMFRPLTRLFSRKHFRTKDPQQNLPPDSQQNLLPDPQQDLLPDPQQNLPQLPSDIKFRILIIGRANAGKTSILQRVCDTTDSPKVYRRDQSGNHERVKLDPSMERGLHNIEDELVFTNHNGYVFHDSRGFEAGGEEELKIVQEFIRRKSQEKRLMDRLHAIWFCIPMDKDRPSLDLKHFGDICPDKNVPVIAVFTKYDQFKREVRMKLEDRHCDPGANIDEEMESIFNQHYLATLTGSPPFIRLEKMHKPSQRCTDLIEMTAKALPSGATLILLAIQKGNLEVNIKRAVEWTYEEFEDGRGNSKTVIRTCLVAFPSMWDYTLSEGGGRRLGLSFVDRLADETPKKYTGDAEWFTVPLFKLNSIFTNPPLSIYSDNIHHTMIATILMLECACLFHASSSRPTTSEALDKAYSQYQALKTHDAVMTQFPKPFEEYSILQFTEFVLSHSLS